MLPDCDDLNALKEFNYPNDLYLSFFLHRFANYPQVVVVDDDDDNCVEAEEEAIR